MMSRTITLIIAIFFAVAASVHADEQTHAAKTATLNWLAHLDNGDYQASWDSAASLFKNQVSAKQWRKAAAGVREPLGAVQSRELMTETLTNSLPGVPDGQYVVFQFRTVFANKAEAVETVTPMLDNGEWRVSGYFVK